MRYVLVFLAVVNAVPYALYLLLREPAAQGQTWPLFVWLLPTVWAPTVVALLLTGWRDGAAGVKKALHGLRWPHAGHRWLVIACVVPATATAAAVLTARAAGEGAPFVPPIAIPFLVAMQFVTGAVGEELGWRGFLLPRLRAQFGTVPAVWLSAGLWSVWHVPSFFFPGMPQQQVPPFLFLLPVAFTGVFLGLIFTKSGDSVVAAMVGHLSLNITLALRGAEGGSHAFWWTLLIAYGALAVVGSMILRVGVPPHAARGPLDVPLTRP